jgi:glucuronoarabinoxylan endo-1,4-beta-xylanase
MSNREKVLIILSFAVLFFPVGASSATVTVDFTKTYQVIDGFGGSTAWSGALSDAVMDALYGNASNQIGLTIDRLRIDPKNSWNDEKSNATKAKARGATVFATPWSPPTSMKTNGNTVKGGIVTSKFADFAAWMKSFWTFCGEGNVDIMSLENEPDYAEQITYEGCTWTAANFLDFCKNYAPQIGKPIMMPESFGFNFALSDPTLNDATAAANVSYIGGHLYGIGPKKYTKALDLGKHVWETEHYYSGDGASQCMSTAKEIFDCMNCNFSAYVWWWMTYSSTDGIYSGNAPNHKGWVLGQFSKWVRPGFHRVDATYNPQSGVYAVAFKGKQYVIVAMNNTSSSQSVTFTCSNGAFPSVNKYTSSQSKNGANEGSVAVKNNSFTAALDAQSVTTFVTADSGVGASPFEGEYGRNALVKQVPASPFMYLVNGKRLGLPSTINGSWSQAAEIYIMPGNARVSIEKGKSEHVSKK